MEHFDFLKKNWIVLFIFCILIFIIYGQSLSGDFVYDDRNILANIETLSGVKNIGQTIMHPFWSAENGLYRPTTLLSYAGNLLIFGPSPDAFHFINLLLYLFVCFFIYLFLKKLFRQEAWAFGVALLFLVLPIHTEVVANISGRSELLALFFSLLVLLELVKERVNFWLMGLWALLAIGSKETALAVFPLIFIVLYIKEKRLNLEILKKYFRDISAVFVAFSFYFVLRFFSLGINNFFGVKTSLIENPLIFTDLGERIATAFKILWMYFQKMLWPANLCSDYSYNQIPVIHNFFNLETLLGIALLLISIILIIFYLKKKPEISLGFGIFIFSFLPMANILFPTGTIAGERLFFFPSFGFALIISFVFFKFYGLINNKNLKNLLVGLIILLLLFYGIISARRQAVWLSEESLFLSAGQCAPQSVLSRSNSGAIYLLKGDLDKAEEELKFAKSIKPIYSKGLNNLGLVYFRKGEKEKARELYLEAIKQDFPYSGAYENLVLLYLSEENTNMAKHWLMYLYPGKEELIDDLIENYMKDFKK